MVRDELWSPTFAESSTGGDIAYKLCVFGAGIVRYLNVSEIGFIIGGRYMR